MNENEFKGWLEKKEEKQSKTGQSFWSVTIAGRRYNAWESCSGIVKDIPVGSAVKGTFKQNGSYYNLETIGITDELVDAPAPNSTTERIVGGYNPDGARIGMAVNNAANHVNAMILDMSAKAYKEKTDFTITAETWAGMVVEHAKMLLAEMKKHELG